MCRNGNKQLDFVSPFLPAGQIVWAEVRLSVDPSNVYVQKGHSTNVTVEADELSGKISVYIYVQHDDLVQASPGRVELSPEQPSAQVVLRTTGAGHSDVTTNSTSPGVDSSGAYTRVTIYKVASLDILSAVVGWVYFVAWSVSFYPQIYSNYRRKSVVGLNFDFQALNLLGFFLYSLFNIGLYAIPEVKAEYAARHPRGLNPVQVNDIIFALHAFTAVLVTVTQCFIYEKGDQRVSLSTRILMGLFGAFLVVSAILAGTHVVHWLDFLTYCSYVKLTITLIKYVPQAWMNHKRRSTVGWSIGNIFLDFTGGTLSMLQMFILSYNYGGLRARWGSSRYVLENRLSGSR